MDDPDLLIKERVSDIVLKHRHDPRTSIVLEAGMKAIATVLRAAAAGNVQCKETAKEITPLLLKLLRK